MKTCSRLLLALVALVLPTEMAWSAQQQIHLLAVATNRSKKQGSVHLFDRYAKKVHRAWAKHRKGHFQAHSLLGPQATRDNVLNGIRRLEQQSGKNTLSVIFLDMHGTAGKSGFRMGTAGKGRLLNASDLHRELPKFKGNVLVILDTCNAGAFLSPKHGELPPNVAVIAACGPKQLAYGKLPHALAEALSGKADYNRNRVVSLGEVGRYIKANHKTKRTQPVMHIPKKMTRLPLARR